MKDAWFQVQLYNGDRNNPFAARFFLKLSDFTGAAERLLDPATFGDRRVAPSNEDFEITTPISSDGPTLTIAVKRKDAFSSHWYDLHVAVAGRSGALDSSLAVQPIAQPKRVNARQAPVASRKSRIMVST